MDMGPIGRQVKVLVLGGTGFIGRHAVAALLDLNAHVIIGTRTPARSSEKRSGPADDCEHREIRFESLVDVENWPDLIDDVDAVLNCVGILRQRGHATYDRVHHLAPEALAAACAALGKRFVHVSALGLHENAGSRFLTSKLKGEHRIRMSGADWVIARPSLIDGEGGFGARWLRGIARLPFYAVPMDARGRIAAVDADDIGLGLARLAVASAVELDLGRSREFELGGPAAYVFREYVSGLRKNFTNSPQLPIPVPGILARGFAHLCDLLHLTPFSYGHWELLRRDNMPNANRLPELLGREPVAVAPRERSTTPTD